MPIKYMFCVTQILCRPPSLANMCVCAIERWWYRWRFGHLPKPSNAPSQVINISYAVVNCFLCRLLLSLVFVIYRRKTILPMSIGAFSHFFPDLGSLVRRIPHINRYKTNVCVVVWFDYEKRHEHPFRLVLVTPSSSLNRKIPLHREQKDGKNKSNHCSHVHRFKQTERKQSDYKSNQPATESASEQQKEEKKQKESEERCRLGGWCFTSAFFLFCTFDSHRKWIMCALCGR